MHFTSFIDDDLKITSQKEKKKKNPATQMTFQVRMTVLVRSLMIFFPYCRNVTLNQENRESNCYSRGVVFQRATDSCLGYGLDHVYLTGT